MSEYPYSSQARLRTEISALGDYLMTTCKNRPSTAILFLIRERNNMSNKLIALHGIDLDKACAIALGWKLHQTKNPQDAFYLTEEKPVLANFWKPTQSSRQCMRLMLDHCIGTEYITKAGIWKASVSNDTQTIEAKAKRLHEAVCRCFLMNQVAKGIISEEDIIF